MDAIVEGKFASNPPDQSFILRKRANILISRAKRGICYRDEGGALV